MWHVARPALTLSLTSPRNECLHLTARICTESDFQKPNPNIPVACSGRQKLPTILAMVPSCPPFAGKSSVAHLHKVLFETGFDDSRSEERRVGKECRSRGSPDR